MRSERNSDLRQYAAQKRVYNIEIAERLGMSVSSVYNLLNRDLTYAQKEQIREAIDELAAARK